MKIVLLASTGPDFDWIADYYLHAFPEGGANAYRQLDRAFANLADNPHLGKPIAQTRYRQYSVPRTPFNLVYRIGDEALEILHIKDQRSGPSAASLQDDGNG
jgi:plasmid stabilization system protein ParE